MRPAYDFEAIGSTFDISPTTLSAVEKAYSWDVVGIGTVHRAFRPASARISVNSVGLTDAYLSQN